MDELLEVNPLMEAMRVKKRRDVPERPLRSGTGSEQREEGEVHEQE